MKGYPKEIRTRKDLDVAMGLNPEWAKAQVAAWLDQVEGWRIDRKLGESEVGDESAGHRVREVEMDDGTTERYQETWGPMPRSMISRLGISKQEAEGLIKD